MNNDEICILFLSDHLYKSIIDSIYVHIEKPSICNINNSIKVFIFII